MAVYSLDRVFLGQPALDTGYADPLGLDVVFQGLPFTVVESPATPLDCTASTSQGQTTAAIGEHNDAVEPVDVTVATSQGQSQSGTASWVLDMVASTSQAQGAAGTGAVRDNWTVTYTDQIIDQYRGFDALLVDFPSFDIADGNHLIVGLYYYSSGDYPVTATVSDSAGGTWTAIDSTYVPTSPLTGTVHHQWFYSLNRAADTGIVISIDLTNPCTMSAVLIQADSPDGTTAAYDTYSTTGRTTNGSSVSTTITTHSTGGGVMAFSEYSYWGGDSTGTFSHGTTLDGSGASGFGYEILTGALTAASRSFSGSDFGLRSISAFALKEADAPQGGTTYQGQSTSGTASTAIDAVVATAQGQSAAGTAGSIDFDVALAQGQGAAALVSVGIDCAVATAQGQSTAVEAIAIGAGSLLTSQAQSLVAAAGIGIDAAVTSGQGQSNSAEAITAVDSTGVTSQCQSTQINAVVAVLMDVAGLQAQTAAGVLAARHVMDVATGQGQAAAASGGTAINVHLVTSQGQHVAGAAGTSINATVVTRQAQGVDADARAESDQSVATKQGQSVAGALVQTSVAVVGLAQGQQMDAAAGTAIDATASTGQAQQMGKGLSLLHIVFDATVSTAQAQGASLTAPAPYVPQEGELTATISFREAVQGWVDTRNPTSVIIRAEAALAGRVETRPVP